MRVDVVERVDLAAIGRGPALIVDDILDEQCTHAEQFGVTPHPALVRQSLVARCVRDHQHGLVSHVQAPDQFDGVLDALALHHPGGLQHQRVVGGDAEGVAHVGVVVVDAGRRTVVVHHVRNEMRVGPGTQRQLIARRAVDHHVADRMQSRREGTAQVVGNAVQHEPLALPGEVVMMPDGGNARLGDHLGDGQAEGNVEWNGQRVLRHQHVDGVAPDEVVDAAFQFIAQLVDARGDRARTGVGMEQVLLDFLYVGVVEVRLGQQQRALLRGVELAGAVEDIVTHALEHGGPLVDFQGDTVGAGDPERDEPYVAPLHDDLTISAGAGPVCAASARSPPGSRGRVRCAQSSPGDRTPRDRSGAAVRFR